MGKKRGNNFGFWFFEQLIKLFGVNAGYFLLIFVTFYYLFFDLKAVQNSLPYLSRRFRCHLFFITKYYHAYRLFFSQGIALIDRHIFLHNKNYFTVEHIGKDNFISLLEELNSGMIMLTSHVGNWQLTIETLNLIDKKVFLIMNSESNEAVKKYLEISKSKQNIKIIVPSNDNMGGVIDIINALKDNSIIAIMGDRLYESKEQVCTKFLGDDAYFPVSPYKLAASLKIPIVEFFSYKKKNKYFIDSTNRIYPEKNNNYEKYASQYVSCLEEFVKIRPYQAFLFYDMWKGLK